MNIDLSTGNYAQSLEINARYDLQAPYVRVRYETVNNIQGTQALVVITDQYPDPLPADPNQVFAGLDFTVDLQGANVTQTEAKIVVDPVNALAADVNTQRAWWLGKHPQYQPFDPTQPGTPADPDNAITSFEIIPGSATRTPTAGGVDAGYANELTSGQIAPWMNFGAQRVTFNCKADVIYRNGTVKQNHPLTYQCVVTNGSTGTYNSTRVNAYAEPVPLNVARYLHDALHPLQFEGHVTLQEEEVSAAIAIGNTLNLVNGDLAEWSAMASLIQEVTENIDTGQTTLHFGPPKHLSAGDIVDLLRVNRNRHLFVMFSMQQAGTPGYGGSSVELGQTTPEKNSSSSTAPPQTHVTSWNVDGTDAVAAHQSSPSQDGIGPVDALSYWGTNFAGDKPMAAPANRPVGSAILIRLSDAQGNAMWVQPLKICMNGVPGTIYFLCSKFIPD